MSRLVACLLLLSAPGGAHAAETYVVAGTVVNSLTRAPLPKARVFLVESRSKNEPVSVVTGADGRFQFTQVPAGKYSLSAERNGFVRQAYNQRRLYQRYSSAVVTGPDESTSELEFALVPGAVISGRVVDVSGEAVHWARGQLYRITGTGENRSAQSMGITTTDDLGAFRFANVAAGRYLLTMQGKPWYAEENSSRTEDALTYPLTFYPAATNPLSGELIEVAAGQEFRADVTMAPVSSYTVLVKRPVDVKGATPYLIFGGPTIYGAASFTQGSQYLHSEINPMRMAGGRYRLTVSQGQTSRVAVREVEVVRNGQEIEFDTAPLAVVRGSVEARGGSAKLGPQPAVDLHRPGSADGGVRAIDTDGSFQLEGLPQGAYRVEFVTRELFAIRSISVKGATVTDGLVVIPATGVVELRIVVDTDVADVEGRLRSNDRGVSGALVVVTAKGRIHDTWLQRMDQTDSDGSFSWRGLAPGEYLAFVFPEGDETLAADPAYLQGFLENAIPVTIQGTGKQKVDLTLPAPSK